MQIKPGVIGFSTFSKFKFDIKHIFGLFIRFFTSSQITHSFIITKPFGDNIPSVLEASDLCAMVPFEKKYLNNPDELFILFKIEDKYLENAEKASDECFIEFAGVQYAFASIPWFIWRWFNEKLLKRSITNEKNWFTDNIVCSELVYWFLIKLHPIFKELLKDFNGDTIQAEDIFKIAKQNPDVFKIIYNKGIII